MCIRHFFFFFFFFDNFFFFLIRPLSCGGFGSSEQADSPLEMMYNREIGKVCLETRDDAIKASCSSDGM